MIGVAFNFGRQAAGANALGGPSQKLPNALSGTRATPVHSGLFCLAGIPAPRGHAAGTVGETSLGRMLRSEGGILRQKAGGRFGGYQHRTPPIKMKSKAAVGALELILGAIVRRAHGW
jgi:hypothetical protein